MTAADASPHAPAAEDAARAAERIDALIAAARYRGTVSHEVFSDGARWMADQAVAAARTALLEAITKDGAS